MPYTRTTWVDYPATTTPITAARLNNIETGILAIESGQGAITNGIFINEAARDAAITSPVEGMRAYLTAPTVPAATGNRAAVPTGITTIYNGTTWVCITPVASGQSAVTNTTSTSYTPLLSGESTACSVTLVTGTTALISISAQVSNSGVNGATFMCFSVSGATTVAASDNTGLAVTSATANAACSLVRTFVYTSLNAGTNTFTLNYQVSAGTGNYTHRAITVQGVA